MHRVAHVDMSGKLNGKGPVAVAITFSDGSHTGTTLRRKDVERLLSGPNSTERAKLFGILIFLLIRNNLDRFEKLVVCNDERWDVVHNTLKQLFSKKERTPVWANIGEERERLGKPRLRSEAHAAANAYRKRGLQPGRIERGRALVITHSTYAEIKQRIVEIEDKKGKMT